MSKEIICSGAIDNLREMIYWNAIGGCFPGSCGCSDICPSFIKGETPEKCTVVSGYIESVFKMMVRVFPQQITEDVSFRIGMHLIPLYKTLCRLKMQEYKETEVMLHSISGGCRINPIFKEIRDTVAAIERVWINLGFIIKESNFNKKKDGSNATFFNGKSYYEVIEAGEMPMRDDNEH